MWFFLLGLLGCDPIGAVTRASLEPAPASPYQVYLLRKGAAGWVRDPAPFAWAFSSLHAVEWGNELVVAGLPSARPPSWHEELVPRLAVGALVTGDLRSWASRSYRVEAPGPSLIDPALVSGPDGIELWFVSIDGKGDPAEGGRLSRVYRAHWLDDHFGNAEVWATGSGLVDPSPVWFSGGWRLFATAHHGEVVVFDSPGGSSRTVAGGLTVPFAWVEGEEVHVLAQRPDARGPVPVELRSADLRAWSAPTPVAASLGEGGCASPVYGRLGAEGVIVCVAERGMPGGAAPR